MGSRFERACSSVTTRTSRRRAHELTRRGAEILLMPTLDEGGWGGTQHVEHALLPRLRAIENRRPVVQAATSGVSQIIDDRGRVLAEVPYRLNRRPQRPSLFHEGTAHASIRPNGTMSVYSQFGFWFGPAMAAAAIAIVVASIRIRSFNLSKARLQQSGPYAHPARGDH